MLFHTIELDLLAQRMKLHHLGIPEGILAFDARHGAAHRWAAWKLRGCEPDLRSTLIDLIKMKAQH